MRQDKKSSNWILDNPKNLLIIALILTIPIIIVVAVILFYDNSTDLKDQTGEETRTIPSNTITIAPTVDAFPGWLSYNDTSQKLKLRYPRDFKLEGNISREGPHLIISDYDNSILLIIGSSQIDNSSAKLVALENKYQIKDLNGDIIKATQYNRDNTTYNKSFSKTHLTYELRSDLFAEMTIEQFESFTYCAKPPLANIELCKADPTCVVGCDGFTKEVVSKEGPSEEVINQMLKVIGSIESTKQEYITY